MNRFCDQAANQFDDPSRNEQVRSVDRIDLREGTPRIATEGKQIGIVEDSGRPLSHPMTRRSAPIERSDQAQRQAIETSYYHIRTELFRCLKGLKLEGVETIVLEEMRYMSTGTRDRFSTGGQAAICLVINQGCQLAEMPMRGKGSSHEVRVALQDFAEVSQLRQD